MNDTPLPYAPPTPEQLAALKKTHGEIHELYNEHASVWIRRPKKADFKAWQADRDNDGRHAVAGEQLLRSTVVHPDQTGLDALFETFPAIPDNLANQALHLMGVSNSAGHRKS
jgi:hypothetical protein